MHGRAHVSRADVVTENARTSGGAVGVGVAAGEVEQDDEAVYEEVDLADMEFDEVEEVSVALSRVHLTWIVCVFACS